MPTIPTLPTWGPTGTITAATVNTNFSTIRTYVNTYCAFLDVASTFSAAQTFSGGITVSGSHATISATSGELRVTGSSGAVVIGTDPGGTSGLRVQNANILANLNATSTDGRVELRVSGTRVGLLGWVATNCYLEADGTNEILFKTGGATRVTIATGGLVTFAQGLTVSSGTTTVQALTAAGLITANASITVPAGQGITLAGTAADVLTFSGASPRIQLPSSSLGFYDGTTLRSFMTASGTFVMGDNSALAGAATEPFLALSRMNGPASGDAAYIGAVVWDATNKKIGVHTGSGTWVYTAALT